MKKKELLTVPVSIGLILVLVIVASILGHAKPAAGQVNITIGVGPGGGAMAARYEGISETVRMNHPDWVVTSVASGSTSEGLSRVMAGELDFTANSTEKAKLALRGAAPFQKPLQVRSIVGDEDGAPYCFPIDAKLGFTSIKEIIRKKYPLRINVGPVGSTARATNAAVMAQYGIALEDFEKWGGKLFGVFQAPGFNLMADGLADVSAAAWGSPVRRLIELAKKRKVRVLALEDDVIAGLEKEGYIPMSIKAGTYEWEKSDIPSAALIHFLLTSESTPQDIVYEVTKAIWEHKDYLAKVHAQFKRGLTPESVLSLNKIVPLHEGAKKYYKEMGFLK